MQFRFKIDVLQATDINRPALVATLNTTIESHERDEYGPYLPDDDITYDHAFEVVECWFAMKGQTRIGDGLPEGISFEYDCAQAEVMKR